MTSLRKFCSAVSGTFCDFSNHTINACSPKRLPKKNTAVWLKEVMKELTQVRFKANIITENGTVKGTGDFLDELPNFHIDTFSELGEHSGRFAEVLESDVEKLIENE